MRPSLLTGTHPVKRYFLRGRERSFGRACKPSPTISNNYLHEHVCRCPRSPVSLFTHTDTFTRTHGIPPLRAFTLYLVHTDTTQSAHIMHLRTRTYHGALENCAWNAYTPSLARVRIDGSRARKPYLTSIKPLKTRTHTADRARTVKQSLFLMYCG